MKRSGKLFLIARGYLKMDFIELMKVLGFAVSAFIVYRLMVREKKDKTKGHYTRPG